MLDESEREPSMSSIITTDSQWKKMALGFVYCLLEFEFEYGVNFVYDMISNYLSSRYCMNIL